MYTYIVKLTIKKIKNLYSRWALIFLQGSVVKLQSRRRGRNLCKYVSQIKGTVNDRERILCAS